MLKSTRTFYDSSVGFLEINISSTVLLPAWEHKDKKTLTEASIKANNAYTKSGRKSPDTISPLPTWSYLKLPHNLGFMSFLMPSMVSSKTRLAISTNNKPQIWENSSRKGFAGPFCSHMTSSMTSPAAVSAPELTCPQQGCGSSRTFPRREIKQVSTLQGKHWGVFFKPLL